MELEDRTTPAVYGVRLLSPPAGEPGDTFARHSGELRPINPAPNGMAVAEAATPAEAVRKALAGTITATVGKQSAAYPFGPATAGLSRADKQPFWVDERKDGVRVWLEDLARMPGVRPDWDYNDRSWRVEVRPLAATGGVTGGGGFQAFSGSYPQTVATGQAVWYPAMAEGPDQVTLVETVTQLSDTEYEWKFKFTNTSSKSPYGNPVPFYDSGAGLVEVNVVQDLLSVIGGHTTTGGWLATEYPAPNLLPTLGVPGLAWKHGQILLPGKSETFTFYTSPMPVLWGWGMATTPAYDAQATGALMYPGTLAVGDTVWFDADGDGLQDEGEEGIYGAEVRLLDANGSTAYHADGTPVDPVVTSGGKYLFDGLLPGDYQLEFVNPVGYAFTSKDAPDGSNANDMIDSDVDPGTGRTAVFTLIGPDPNLDMDCGVILEPDLDIIDSSGNEVPEDREESPGGWVAVNNDNDNYDFVGDPGSSLEHRYDKDEAGAVADENDLVKIKAKIPVGAQGSYKLEWDSTIIKVWRFDIRGQAVASGTAVPAGLETEYWVEGQGISSAVAAEEIRLMQTDGAGTLAIDKVKLTVYEITGAMNVPGHSEYFYQVRYPGGPQTEVSWGTVTEGRYATDPQTTEANGYTTNKRLIHWNEGGGNSGKYRVAVPNGLFNDREVNVVKIALASGDNWMKYNNDIVQSSVAGQEYMLVTKTTPGMQSSLAVSEVKGSVPAAGGPRRGVRFMAMGMVQFASIAEKAGRYETFGKTLRSSVVNNFYIDCYVSPDGMTTSHPWYEDEALVRRYASSDTMTGPLFLTQDSPRSVSTDPTRFVWSRTVNGVQETDKADVLRTQIGFLMYFAVATRDPTAPAFSTALTARASAYWQWWADGGVNQNTSVWTNADVGIVGDSKFTETTEGARLNTSYPIGNLALRNETWAEHSS